jgi:hypothetical protein
MCSEASTAAAQPVAHEDLLNQVLNAEAAPVPKVSVPLPAVEGLKQKLATLNTTLGAAQPDEELTYHVTSEEAFLSSAQPGLVAVMGARGALLVKVDPPATAADGTIESPLWNFGLTVVPAGSAVPTAAHINIGVAVGGSSAKIASYGTSPTASAELGALGFNPLCIIKNGGASILTTIVSCLPSLAGGPEAFIAALTAALGPGSVDLITKIMSCF